MSLNSAFAPRGNVISVTSSGTTLTPLSQFISFAPSPAQRPAAQDSGLDGMPPVARFTNLSAGIVYASITTQPRTAAIPATGAPSLEMPIPANGTLDIVVPQPPAQPNAANPYTVSVNTVAVGTSAQLLVQFGEGL